MKLEKPLYAVNDANGEFLGLFSDEEAANKTAKYHGAYVTPVDEVLDKPFYRE